MAALGRRVIVFVEVVACLDLNAVVYFLPPLVRLQSSRGQHSRCRSRRAWFNGDKRLPAARETPSSCQSEPAARRPTTTPPDPRRDLPGYSRRNATARSGHRASDNRRRAYSACLVSWWLSWPCRVQVEKVGGLRLGARGTEGCFLLVVVAQMAGLGIFGSASNRQVAGHYSSHCLVLLLSTNSLHCTIPLTWISLLT